MALDPQKMFLFSSLTQGRQSSNRTLFFPFLNIQSEACDLPNQKNVKKNENISKRVFP